MSDGVILISTNVVFYSRSSPPSDTRIRTHARTHARAFIRPNSHILTETNGMVENVHKDGEALAA